MNQQQKKWVEDYCNEVIEPEDFKAFEEALLEDADFRARTRSYLAMDSLLRQGEENAELILNAWATPAPRPLLHNLPWVVLAAMLALFAGYFLNSAFDRNSSPRPLTPEVADSIPNFHGVAVISHSSNAVWGGNNNLKIGDILAPGELVLESGLAEIEVFSGTRILLDGPTKLDLVSLVQVVCEYGKIRAHVPPHARGFRVDCKQFHLVDLGIEFGMEVDLSGEAEVHVFDGEVEIFDAVDEHRPEAMTVVSAGDGLAWKSVGKHSTHELSKPENYPSFDTIATQRLEATDSRMARWKEWGATVDNDPRLLIRYRFQQNASVLIDSSPSQLHGTIVGTEQARGRWTGKSGREFKRPSDRIRIDVPGAHDALTLMTWIRVDALPEHNQGLLLPDSYDNGRPHWVITTQGDMYFGVRIPDAPDGSKINKGYFAQGIFNRQTIETWICFAFTYDRQAMTATHYVDGVEVAREKLVADQPLEIGAAAIGNWGLRPDLFTNNEELQNLVGRMDDFAIWSAPLSPTEIHECYEASRP